MVKRKLLVVDDVELNRLILKNLFEEQFEVLEAENGLTALGLIELHKDNLAGVLLDLIMPVMDGFEVLLKLNENKLIEKFPVIMITGEKGEEETLTGYKLGVADIVSKPFSSDIVFRRVNNVVDLYANKKNLEEKLREQKEELEQQASRLRQANQFIIDALSTIVEFRDLESGEHIKRIRVLTKITLQALRNHYPLSDEDIEIISHASAMHDVGKIAIPDKILLKPGRLTDEEFEIMKTHTTQGCNILSSLGYMQDEQYYTYCYEICRYHHERWDGRGYPDGLKGDEIPIWAQATSLADVYDALTSKRVYKDAYSHEEAVKMILEGKCGAFNPIMMECFGKVQEAFCDHSTNSTEG